MWFQSMGKVDHPSDDDTTPNANDNANGQVANGKAPAQQQSQSTSSNANAELLNFNAASPVFQTPPHLVQPSMSAGKLGDVSPMDSDEKPIATKNANLLDF